MNNLSNLPLILRPTEQQISESPDSFDSPVISEDAPVVLPPRMEKGSSLRTLREKARTYGFSRFWKISKDRLSGYIREYEESGNTVIPRAMKRRVTAGNSCMEDEECYSKKCVETVCKRSRNRSPRQPKANKVSLNSVSVMPSDDAVSFDLDQPVNKSLVRAVPLKSKQVKVSKAKPSKPVKKSSPPREPSKPSSRKPSKLSSSNTIIVRKNSSKREQVATCMNTCVSTCVSSLLPPKRNSKKATA